MPSGGAAAAPKSSVWQTGGYVGGGPTKVVPSVNAPSNYNYAMNPALGGSIQGLSTQAKPAVAPVTGGGGQTGGQVGGQTDSGGGIPQQQYPSAPSEDYSALIAAPMQALSDMEGVIQGRYGSDVAGAEQGATQQTTSLQQQQALGEQSFANQRTQATGVKESAVAEARRQAAEIQKGIQSNYGGTTGTGAFVSDLSGRQALQTIQSYNTSYQTALSKIGEAESSLKQDVTDKIATINQNLTQTKAQLSNQLKTDLTNIAYQKGQLESQKAEARMSALANYQNAIAQVNDSNTKFQQEVYLNAQKATDALTQIKAKAQTSFQLALQRANIQRPDVNVSNFNPTTGALQNVGTVKAGTRILTKDVWGNTVEASQPTDTSTAGALNLQDQQDLLDSLNQ